MAENGKNAKKNKNKSWKQEKTICGEPAGRGPPSINDRKSAYEAMILNSNFARWEWIGIKLGNFLLLIVWIELFGWHDPKFY